jgi:tetratricopeptide (TPR) repeat protein
MEEMLQRLFMCLIGILLLTNICNAQSSAQYSEMYFQRAVDQTRVGSHTEAIIACTYLIKADSSRSELFYLRSYNFFKLGNKSAAMRDVDLCLSIDPLKSEAHLLRAKINSSSGRFIDAYKDYRRARELNPVQAVLSITKDFFSFVVPGSS